MTGFLFHPFSWFMVGSQDSIPSLLQEAFILTDRLFFENMEPLLANKGVIQSDLGVSDATVSDWGKNPVD